MISNLLVVAGLCACCGFGALRTSPSIKNAISESVGNNQLSTPLTSGEFVIDDVHEFNFGLVNFESTTPISIWNTYSNSYTNAFDGSLWFRDDNNTFIDIFPNANTAGAYSTQYDIAFVSYYLRENHQNSLFFTFGISTESARNLSDDGVNVYFDLTTTDFNFDITTCTFEVDYFDNGFVDDYYGFVLPFGGWYHNTLTGYDPVGADYDYSPFAFDWQYTYWNTESGDYQTSPRLGISTSFVNTNTNGIDSFNHPFYWNHFVYAIKWTDTDTTFESPFGDNIFVSYSMKGLSSSSSGAYQNGYNTGYEEGYYSGVNTAQNGSYQDGYTAGYNAGLSSNNTSWLGLFGAVADTPIMMLRGLFGYELFGINVLSVVLSLFTGLIIFYLLRKLL